MSSFETPKAAPCVAVKGKRPSLKHRSSDPEFSDAEMDDAVDLGENAVWAHLEEPIYSEKDVEVFRPTQNGSSLPVYYTKGWLPFSADTLFNTLLDVRYRTLWDKNVHQIHVIEHQHVSDVMYCALKLPWPLANRDYVYRRRVKFYPIENTFVVLYQAAHHADAPATRNIVRVETCTLRLCIRNLASSRNTCDFHLEYEDDTNFSIPNYGINLLLHTMLPSFMTGLRKACNGYADFIKTLDNSATSKIPSEVVRHRSTASSLESVSPLCGITTSEVRNPTRTSPRPQSPSFNPRFINSKSKGMRREMDQPSTNYKTDEISRTTVAVSNEEVPVISSSRSTDDSIQEGSCRASSSATSFYSPFVMPSSTAFSYTSSVTSAQTVPLLKVEAVTSVNDDFVVHFQKQKIGLHLETDLFSNQVFVVDCEKDSEAAATWNKRIVPGILVTSINGVSVRDFYFTDILSEIQRANRPLTLGFTHPSRDVSFESRRFQEPPNVLRCLLSQDSKTLIKALCPLDNNGVVSAVLKYDFFAPAASVNERGNGSSRVFVPHIETEQVFVPAGSVIYEINDVVVFNLPFQEILCLLRSRDMSVVTFKAGITISGRSKQQPMKKRSRISRHLTRLFRKKRRDNNANLSSQTTSFVELQSSKVNTDRFKVNETELIDFSSIQVTLTNLEWVWLQVLQLKKTERLFSAALLLDRLEVFFTDMKSDTTPLLNATVYQRVKDSMCAHEELIDHIKARRDLGVKALMEFHELNQDDEWNFGQTMFGVTTSWKPDPDGSVWIKLEGFVDKVDVFSTIAVIREVDLYSKWAPFCTHSVLLQEMGHVELAAYLSISSPFLQRDTILHAFGINGVYEHGCFLLLGGSVDQVAITSTVAVPILQGWNAGRMEIKGFRAMIEPLSRMQARTCIVANIDPKCAIPKPMLNYGIKKMAGILLYLIRKEAEKIEMEQTNLQPNEYIRRMHNDPSGFYTWLRPIVDRFFYEQAQQNLPTMLSMNSKVPRGSDSCRKRALVHTSATQCSHVQTDTANIRSANGINTSIETHRNPTANRWSDYLDDFAIWPYLLLYVLAKGSNGLPLLYALGLKFVYTCVCTWLAVPGAFPRAVRHSKRMRNELVRLQWQCVVLAAILDVLSSYAGRFWTHWIQCYTEGMLYGSVANEFCFSRSPIKLREAEQLALLTICFVYASAIIGMQIAVKLQ
ncbi:hypothetical protein CCR75_004714 [Bremia lactucae]|uniref:Phosphatidylcholine transfer protein n=1 Tax=Bremia lactucae TaxID=4779 RepID=A0A976NZ98_BRELC|nr:hypothetical protein CCR75_004714 [Bremia lactucae]